MKKHFLRIHNFLSTQMGLDFYKFISFFIYLPSFMSDFFMFKSAFETRWIFSPYLSDKSASAGNFNNEYFWQDLFVAQTIFDSSPSLHVDIGSRIDGFVTHVASFRRLEVFDLRPLKNNIRNIDFTQVDFSLPLDTSFVSYCDSLSCLHAIEHFGLGRYGDKIDPEAYKMGLKNLATILKPGGTLYLSTPVGVPIVRFNANYVFDVSVILQIMFSHGLKLGSFYLIDPEKGPTSYQLTNSSNLNFISSSEYNLGLFIFKK